MSIISTQHDERSHPLRPFAPRGQTINTDVRGNSTLVSYTYPADYGEKMNSVGFIGDRSLAGKKDVQYGTVLDGRTLHYLLTENDVQALLRWMPGGWNLPKLRGILLVEFHLPAMDLPAMDLPAIAWPDIIAMLNSRSPAPAGGPSLFSPWIGAGPYSAWCYIVEHKLWSRVAGSLISALILIYLSHRYAWFSRR